MVVASDNTRRCTVLAMAVYTITSGDHPDSSCALPSPGGHRPSSGGATGQGTTVPAPTPALGLDQLVTATGVAVHQTARGGAPKAALRAWLRLLSSPFDFSFANVLTPPSDHHLVHVC